MQRLCIFVLSTLMLVGCSEDAAGGRNAAANNVVANNGVATDEQAVCGAECAGGDPLCDAQRRVCVECTVDSHCGAAKPACDPRGECRECVGDSDCFGDRPVCDLGENSCAAACTDDGGCPGEDGFQFCDVASGHCLQCRDATDCAGQDESTICGAAGRCLECESDTDCGGEDPFCETGRGRCRECATDSDCASNACIDFECAECAVDADCSAGEPICDLEERKCVLCVGNADCPSESPICDDGDACVECTEDDDCAAGFRCADGACEPA